ncbi:prominin-1-like [Ylistrum balloti]|uniref:prominin-1-like n=1 Tax=Ylistrum balloti TaxID=509963 RepID=UPI002905E6A0|nr:prominin-1-like [Ylistrum balloti]
MNDSTDFSQTLSEYAVSSLTGGAVQRLQDSAESAQHNLDAIDAERNNPSFISAMNTLNSIPGVPGITTPTARDSDLDSIKDKVGDTVDTIKPFDHYRWIAGVSIGGIISLIVGLQFFGLGFGVFGSCRSAPDDPKGCMSNSGGRMIIASIVFIFLFAWLLMLLTTLLFAVGALTEKFMCEPLKDPELTDIESVLNDFVDIKSMLQYQQDAPSLGTILSSCKENKAIYSALQMEKMGNLVDFPALERQITTAKKDMKTQLDDVLNNLAGGSFASVNLTDGAVTTKLDNTKRDISNFDVNAMEKEGVMQQKLVPLKTLTTTIGPLVDDVKIQLASATSAIQNQGEMRKISDHFINNTFDVVDIFYTSTKNAIYEIDHLKTNEFIVSAIESVSFNPSSKKNASRYRK